MILSAPGSRLVRSSPKGHLAPSAGGSIRGASLFGVAYRARTQATGHSQVAVLFSIRTNKEYDGSELEADDGRG